MKKQISTAKAPAAIGPYSQAIEANGMVFVSGQLPVNPETGEFAEGGIKELTRQSLTNMKNILAEAGLGMENVVKTTVFLADMADFAAMNEVYASFFEGVAPARSAVAVKTLPKNALVEIECIAVRYKAGFCDNVMLQGISCSIFFVFGERNRFFLEHLGA